MNVEDIKVEDHVTITHKSLEPDSDCCGCLIGPMPNPKCNECGKEYAWTEKLKVAKPHCCEVSCKSQAEFEITGSPNHGDITQTCRSHVGTLLGTVEGLPKDNTSWTVRSL